MVIGPDIGCCPGCGDGYCQEYAEGIPVLSIHATEDSARVAAMFGVGRRIEKWQVRQ